MSSTTFVDGQTVIFADWLNDVNDFVYKNQVSTYAELRASTVNTEKIEVIGAGIAGVFLRVTGQTWADNGGTRIVRANGDRYERVFVGAADVRWFGAIQSDSSNGAINRAAIQAAFNAHKSILIEGDYFLGDYSTGEFVINLSSLGDGINIQTRNARLLVNTTANVVPSIFYLGANNHFRCGPIRFKDYGYSGLSTPLKGAFGFNLAATASWGDVQIESIHCESMLSPMVCAGGNDVVRIRGIQVGLIVADNCYYGYNGQNQGDGLDIGLIYARETRRPYFVYGVDDHTVNIFNRSGKATSGCVNISRSPGGYNTKGIRVNYVSRDNTVANVTHVLINHIDLLGGVISDIKVHVDIESSIAYDAVRFVNYTGSGGTETSAASPNAVFDVELSGTCDAFARPVTAVASYGSKQRITFNSGTFFDYDATIPAKFFLGKAARSTTVTWSASGTAPVLGNGVISGNFDIAGGLCTFSFDFTAGSTTTFGTGAWSFAAPFVATETTAGSVWVLDNGGLYYVGACLIEAGTSSLRCFGNATATPYAATVPITWATGDRLQATITYPIC